jgi:hypothetical protein
MANPTTNYGWPMPTSTDLVTDLPADFALFGQPVDTSLKALNPETTLGDIAYRSSTSNTNTRLGIGTTGQILTVASGVPSWATLSSTSGLTLITRGTMTAAANSGTTFDNTMTSTYTDYLVVLEGFKSDTSTPTIQFQYRTSGPTTRSTSYYGANGLNTYTSTSYVASNAASSYALCATNNGSNEAATLFITNVGTSKAPNISALITNPAGDRYGSGGCNMGADITPIGFIISASANNLTGTITIYGMAKT